MNKIIIHQPVNECIYNIHPVYNLYAANENGEIVHIARNIKTLGNKNHTFYLMCNVKNLVENKNHI